MQIENVPIENLRPYPRNARTPSKKQICQIAKSIQKFGFCNPVLIDDKEQIIAGQGRVAAAKLLSIDTVPTVARRALAMPLPTRSCWTTPKQRSYSPILPTMFQLTETFAAWGAFGIAISRWGAAR